AGGPLSRAVCRTCGTWYANGESVCPKCHTRLVGGTQNQTVVTPPAAAVQPTSDAPFPSPAQSGSGISWPQWLLIGGGALAGIVVIGVIVTGLLLTGALGPVTSTDGVITVKVPKGWGQTHATWETKGNPFLVPASLGT